MLVAHLQSNAFDQQPFALRLTLGIPAEVSSRPANLIKPIFDGVISALHQHDGSDIMELSSRVAADLKRSPDEIHTLLSSSVGAVLGPHPLLHRFGAGVQWNPRDDLCMAGELLITHTPQIETWTLWGSVDALVVA
jgi:hypothetical protein